MLDRQEDEWINREACSTIEDLKEKVETGEIDTVVVAFTDHYGRVLGKRFDAGHFLEDGLNHGTHGSD